MGLSQYKADALRELRALWGDRIEIWRRKTAPEAAGHYAYALISQGHECNYLATTNYEQNMASRGISSGMVKQDNVFTSDRIRMSTDVVIESGDRLRVTRDGGETFWVSVKGAPMRRTLFQEVYVNATTEPPVSAGAWL